MVLFRNLKRSATEDNYVKIVTFANKTFETAAFATLPTMVSIGNYSGFKNRGWYDAPDQPWKKDKQPYTETELERFFQDDLRSVKRIEGVRSFAAANSFVKLTDIFKLPVKDYQLSGNGYWGNTEYIIQVEKKSTNNFFELTSGYAANPAVDRDVKLAVYKLDDTGKENPVFSFSQSKKVEKEKVSLAALSPGYYRVRVTDEQKMFVLKFSPGINYSITIRPQEKLLTSTVASYNIFYLYVPAGVKNFKISKTISLLLVTPTEKIINM